MTHQPLRDGREVIVDVLRPRVLFRRENVHFLQNTQSCYSSKYVQHKRIWMGFHELSMTSMIFCFCVCAFFFCLNRKPAAFLTFLCLSIIFLGEGQSWKHRATSGLDANGPSATINQCLHRCERSEQHGKALVAEFLRTDSLPGRDLSSQTYVLTWSARKSLLHYSKPYRPPVAELFEFEKKLATIAGPKEQSICSKH